MDQYTLLRNQIDNAFNKAQAFDVLGSRANDAHAYCQTYLMTEAWGRNIWISILRRRN